MNMESWLLLCLLLNTAELGRAVLPVFVAPLKDGSTTRNLDENSGVMTSVLLVQFQETTTIVTGFTAVKTSDNSDATASFSRVGFLISTNIMLDFETTQAYTITVSAEDAIDPDTDTASFQLVVKDLKDVTPALAATNNFNVQWTEEQSAGLAIFPAFTVNDADAGDKHKFSLTGADSSFFFINPTTGEIKARSKLDRDPVGATTVFNQLTLTVTDLGNLQTQQLLTVTLVDINDNAPVCQPALYSNTVPENTIAGTSVVTLSCTDKDEGDNGLIDTYIIFSGVDAATKFQMTGAEVQTTANPLDYEFKPSYTLLVQVVDKGVTPLTGTTTVVVIVGNVNEHDPVFATANYAATVPENTAAGTSVATVTATDDDKGASDGTLRYSITAGNGVGAFTIDSTTGQVTTTGVALDREAAASHTLTVTARDDLPGAASERVATTSVVITVSDVNDNTPLCTPPSYQVSVTEPSVVGARVVLMTATDDDEAGTDAATLVFSITNGDTTADPYFQMNGPELQLAKVANFEAVTSFDLTLRVADSATPALASTCSVKVTIVAANEFSPITTVPNDNVMLAEDTAIGTSVYNVVATDQDQGNGAVITYSIINGNTNNAFFCYPTTGSIVVWNSLDFDTLPQSYNLTVQAADDAGLASTMWLFVQLTDVNDQTPTFSKNIYAVTVNENVPVNTRVETVQTVDSDTAPAGTVTYTVVSGNGATLFTVGGTSGDVSTSGLIDREARSRYSLVVEARDGGTPSRSATALVDITIADLNDITPVFSPKDFTISVNEDATVGTAVTTVNAKDDDAAASNNVFSYVMANAFFAVDSASGVVSLLQTLDRETTAVHVLTVVAPDSGAPPLTGTATVTVLVADVNDNTPVITGTYSPNVVENSALGTIITTVAATDADTGDNARLNYVIRSGNTNDDFVISDVNGAIQVKNTLSRERTATYELVVDVIDNGTPKLTGTTTVTVTVRDVNDNAPVWTQNAFAFTISENVAAGQPVGTVAATDADTGLNAALTYSVVLFWSGSQAHFNLDGATGQLTTATTLDRETTPQYLALLRVTDAGIPQLHAEVNVSIAVTDLNDNEPRFNFISYNVSVLETSAVGTGLLIVTVSDDDIGVNADVTLSIDTSTALGARAAQFLQVTSGSGVVSISQMLDRETDQSFFFTLLAKDGGTPSHTSMANVTVTVVDVNDNVPVFTSTYYNTEIAHSGLCTRSITTLTATDADTGLNGQVTYYVETASATPLFLVDASSGVLALTSTITANTMYSFNVSARDGGTPTLSADPSALIRVDALIPNDVIVTFNLGISSAAFLAQQAVFLQRIQVVARQTYPTAVARLWCANTNTEGLANAHVYFLSDDGTESVANSNAAKYYIPQATARSLFTSDLEGTPNSVLQGAQFAQFGIRAVHPYVETQTPFAQTGSGIAIISIATVLTLILAALVAYMVIRYWRHFKRPESAQKIHVKERTPTTRTNVQPQNDNHKPLPMDFDKDDLFWSRSYRT